VPFHFAVPRPHCTHAKVHKKQDRVRDRPDATNAQDSG
jgi:hypothetical protein